MVLRRIVVIAVPAGLLGAAVVAAGGPEPPREVPPSAALERTYMGVSCPEPNDVSCDRVGVFVDLRQPAAVVTAEVVGRTLALDDPETGDGRTGFAGYLERAGLRGDGPLGVPAEGGRWLGQGHVSVPVTLTITRADGSRERTVAEFTLRAGWG